MPESNITNADGYRLGRGYVAASRLNLQHFLHKDAHGFLLHSTIQDDLRSRQDSGQDGNKDPLHVADLATGTGIWLLDLIKSTEVSGLNVKYHGFDISRALFPHPSWLPKNMAFSTSDLLEEPPEAFQGKFDVVHIRMVLAVVRSNSPKPIIRHIKQLLKPGGYLQWDELDPINHYDVITPTPESESTNMTATFQKVKDLENWSWIAKLPEALREEGFEDAAQSFDTPAPALYPAWTQMDLCAAEELSLHWYGQESDEGENWRRLVPKANEEAAESNGAVLRVGPTVTVARKSL